MRSLASPDMCPRCDRRARAGAGGARDSRPEPGGPGRRVGQLLQPDCERPGQSRRVLPRWARPRGPGRAGQRGQQPGAAQHVRTSRACAAVSTGGFGSASSIAAAVARRSASVSVRPDPPNPAVTWAAARRRRPSRSRGSSRITPAILPIRPVRAHTVSCSVHPTSPTCLSCPSRPFPALRGLKINLRTHLEEPRL